MDMEPVRDEDLIKKAVAARFLQKSLEQRCMGVLLKSINNKKHKFEKLPPPLLNEFLTNVVNELGRQDSRLKVKTQFIKRLMKPNLRSFSWTLLMGKRYEKFELIELWERLVRRCNNLSSFAYPTLDEYLVELELRPKGLEPETSDPVYHMMRDFNQFSNLQQLRVYCFRFACGDTEKLPKIAPRLKVLEMSAETFEKCCQKGLCKLTNLEQLAVGCVDRYRHWGVWPAFYKTLYPTCLAKLPHLQVLTNVELETSSTDFSYQALELCMAAALAQLELEGHQRPLQLRRLCLGGEGIQKHEHLPWLLLGQVKSLRLKDVYCDEALQAVQFFGGDLNQLWVRCYKQYVEMYEVLSHCPNLEDLHLYYAEDNGCGIENPSDIVLPMDHFSRLRIVNLHLDRFRYLGTIVEDFFQLLFASPMLEHFELSSADQREGILNALLKTLPNSDEKRLFQKLRHFYSNISVESGNGSLLVAVLKQMIVAAPKLESLELTPSGYITLTDLEKIQEFCNHIPGLRFKTDCRNIWYWS